MPQSLQQILVAHPWDCLGLVIFFACWLGYEPFLTVISKQSGLIAKDLSVVRHAWMDQMVKRDFKLFDTNLLGHAIDSVTHFSSATLLLIAAVAGVVFGGALNAQTVKDLGLAIDSSEALRMKLALILVTLVRGLLNFVWALRQMNYATAAFGAIPESLDPEKRSAFSEAISQIMDPAMSNFSQGVRGYYFALAASAWLFGPFALILGSLGPWPCCRGVNRDPRQPKGFGRYDFYYNHHLNHNTAIFVQRTINITKGNSFHKIPIIGKRKQIKTFL